MPKTPLNVDYVINYCASNLFNYLAHKFTSKEPSENVCNATPFYLITNCALIPINYRMRKSLAHLRLSNTQLCFNRIYLISYAEHSKRTVSASAPRILNYLINNCV